MAEILNQLIENKENILIDGKKFSHINRKWIKEGCRLSFCNGQELICSLNHQLKMMSGDFNIAETLKVGDIFSTGIKLTKSEIFEYNNFVYDLINVSDNQYETCGIISHNCAFLSSDALLINSMKLQQLRSSKPIFEDLGFKFWKSEEQIGGSKKTYLVSLDPATGSGSDFSVIEVFEFPSLIQVAEWRSNVINIPLCYAKLKWILNKLSMAKPGLGRAEVLWTFERNGIGEAISALYINDEKPPEYAELYSDMPGKYGVYTTSKTKLLSCIQLKNLIEKVSNNLKINSETLLFELKNFVSKGGTYEAKNGSTDDCVMATVGITRLMKRLSEYNDEAFKQVNEYVDPAMVEETTFGYDSNSNTLDNFGDEAVPFLIG